MSKQSDSLLARRDTAVPRGVFNVTRVFAESAREGLIRDVDGKEYVDFASGIGVTTVGHCHPRVVDAVKTQADRLIHTCFHVAMYEPYVALAERLNALAPGEFPKMTALFNSGAEAVENAVKISRKATGRPAVLAGSTAFHGRTLLAMTLTAKVMPYKAGFGPYAPEVYRIPYAYCYRCPLGLAYPECGAACAECLRERFADTVDPASVAAVILEPVSGEGGFIVPPKEYFPRIKAICEEHGILFIADEVQSGVGRTGDIFAINHWSVVPDLVVTAKSLGGGMPISAVTGRSEVMDSPQVGGIGGTYGGNPLSCAAALAVLDVVEEDGLCERSRMTGKKVKDTFQAWAEEFPVIGDVRGLGCMLAMELVLDRATKQPATAKTRELVAYCADKGLLLLSCGHASNVVRTLMPLTISEEHLEQGLSILRDGLLHISQQP